MNTFQSTEYFSIQHTATQTVTMRIMQMADGWIYDHADATFKANATLCTTPDIPCTERTDLGDATNSQYVATVDMTQINNDRRPVQYLVQFRDDTPTILGTTEMRVASAQAIYPGRLSM
jgi:hypothetical protein